MFELGHPQVGDGDEVLRRAEPARRALGLLQQAIHGLHVGVAALVQHPVDDPFNMRLQGSRQLFERLQPRARGPGQPALEAVTRQRLVVAL